MKPACITSAAAMVVGITLLVATGMAGGADRMSDAEKKTAVYRMYDDYKADFPKVVDISVQEAITLAETGAAVFVDTRKPAEIAVSKIPGAVTRDTFLKDPSKFTDKTVIGYCTISYRSGVFAAEMAERGIAITNLRGGILAWTLEGGTVVDPEGRPVRKLHVFGKRWNLAPNGYRTVMFGWLRQLSQ